jgi:hypothetical protein
MRIAHGPLCFADRALPVKGTAGARRLRGSLVDRHPLKHVAQIVLFTRQCEVSDHCAVRLATRHESDGLLRRLLSCTFPQLLGDMPQLLGTVTDITTVREPAGHVLNLDG